MGFLLLFVFVFDIGSARGQNNKPRRFADRDMISTEYFALVGSFLLVGLEALIRVLTLALRKCTIASYFPFSTIAGGN